MDRNPECYRYHYRYLEFEIRRFIHSATTHTGSNYKSTVYSMTTDTTVVGYLYSLVFFWYWGCFGTLYWQFLGFLFGLKLPLNVIRYNHGCFGYGLPSISLSMSLNNENSLLTQRWRKISWSHDQHTGILYQKLSTFLNLKMSCSCNSRN